LEILSSVKFFCAILPFTGPSPQARTIGRLVDYNTRGVLFIFSRTFDFAIDDFSGFRKRLGKG
jgi:hypothetical protein